MKSLHNELDAPPIIAAQAGELAGNLESAKHQPSVRLSAVKSLGRAARDWPAAPGRARRMRPGAAVRRAIAPILRADKASAASEIYYSRPFAESQWRIWPATIGVSATRIGRGKSSRLILVLT